LDDVVRVLEEVGKDWRKWEGIGGGRKGMEEVVNDLRKLESIGGNWEGIEGFGKGLE
jgi:hypothetical protein